MRGALILAGIVGAAYVAYRFILAPRVAAAAASPVAVAPKTGFTNSVSAAIGAR